jgi:hypothetical protein
MLLTLALPLLFSQTLILSPVICDGDFDEPDTRTVPANLNVS